MRMRFKPYAGPELDAWPMCEREPTEQRGKWAQKYTRQNQPLHMELGCGKGGFISILAARNPHINYVGIDITDKVLILAKRNIESAYEKADRPMDNIFISDLNIEIINRAFCESDQVQRIYINFCNPWTRKSGQKKHRLTHTKQLELYKGFLAKDAEIYFKCDNDDLYEDTLVYMQEAGFEVVKQTWDLHAQDSFFDGENIVTEHEKMFTDMGLPTHALIARLKSV